MSASNATPHRMSYLETNSPTPEALPSFPITSRSPLSSQLSLSREQSRSQSRERWNERGEKSDTMGMGMGSVRKRLSMLKVGKAVLKKSSKGSVRGREMGVGETVAEE